MNEQIKRLAEEAGFVLWGDEEWNPGDVIDWASNYDSAIVKYTELVIADVFNRIKELNKQQAIIMHEDLKQMVIDYYGENNHERTN